MPELAISLRAIPGGVVCLGGPHPAKLEPIAKVLPIRRIGDESCSPSAEPSQCCFTLGINKEDFLKIENIAAALVYRSRNAKQFLRP